MKAATSWSSPRVGGHASGGSTKGCPSRCPRALALLAAAGMLLVLLSAWRLSALPPHPHPCHHEAGHAPCDLEGDDVEPATAGGAPQPAGEGGAMTAALPRLHARGKFLFAGPRGGPADKWFARGVTYGTFAGGFPSRARVAADFAAMAAAGVNSVRTYEPPPLWLLDAAAAEGLRIMAGLAWNQHHLMPWLDARWHQPQIQQRVRRAVREVAGHPALAMWVVGNEIAPDLARWVGAPRVQAMLNRLIAAVREADPGALVTYAGYPSTEYIYSGAGLNVDVVSFNVYLEDSKSFEDYLPRLQNLAGHLPLLISEMGLDTARNNETEQAALLAAQLPAAFAAGVIGTYVFSWTDEWHRGGKEVTDWNFGLVTRGRRPKPALAAVTAAYAAAPFNASAPWPSITVAVATYNSESTLWDTCLALAQLDYPRHEILFVNDGSTDGTPAVLERCVALLGARARVLVQANCGLSCARNAALNASSTEIVAYTDGDALPDPHWLRYIALRFMRSPRLAGVGGQSLAPLGYGPVADALAWAPGGAAHVLLNDTYADHVAGCNSAFRRKRLIAAGGWDEFFRVAGDDVDVVWRLQADGGVGYHASAVVWHRRRPTLAGFLKQQRGYGQAEAMVELRQPQRFTSTGYMRWAGAVYGQGGDCSAEGGTIFHGIWGRAPFQQEGELAPRSSCSAASSLWALRQTALCAALALALALATGWKRIRMPAAALLLACTGLLAALAWRSAATSVAQRLPHLTSTGARLQATAPLAAATLLQPVMRDYGNAAFWWLEAPTSTWLGPRSARLLPRPLERDLTVPVVNGSALFAGADPLPLFEAAVRAAARGDGSAVALGVGDPTSADDFAIKDSHLAGATASLLLEYVHAGKAQLYLRAFPYVTAPAALWLAALVAGAALAAADGCPAARNTLSVAAAMLAWSIWAGCCRALSLFGEAHAGTVLALLAPANITAAPAPMLAL